MAWRNTLACVVVLNVMVLFVFMKPRFGYKRTVEGDASDCKPAVKGYPERAQPRFLYAIQTERCLPIHLKKALGNPNECNCDVLVLSYKHRCKAVFPRHVKYINGYSLSWPEGRNLLWQVAKSRHTQYLYYIFIDDDIIL